MINTKLQVNELNTSSLSTAYNNMHNGIAIGNKATVSAANSVQIGNGTNVLLSSLLFINTTVVNSDGVIPTSSLELKTTIINALSDIQSITSFDVSAIQTIVTALSNLYSAINS